MVKRQIAILGGGSWGTALAVHLAGNNHTVKIWEFVAEQARKMQQERCCPLLPQVTLPSSIYATSDLQEAMHDADIVLLAVPSQNAEQTIQSAKAHLQQQPLIICSKGFAAGVRLLSVALRELIPNELYCLYGPTHAEEVCQGKFSGVVLAGGKGKERLKEVIESRNLNVELSDDSIGVQVAAALKNVLAISVGMLQGAGLGDNAKAYVLTKGLQEIQQLGAAMGAERETFYGLAGLGDVIVTCTSVHSRNFYLGQQVGKGRSLAEVQAEMKMVAEGVAAVEAIPVLERRYNLKLPLLHIAYSVLREGKKVSEMLLCSK